LDLSAKTEKGISPSNQNQMGKLLCMKQTERRGGSASASASPRKRLNLKSEGWRGGGQKRKPRTRDSFDFLHFHFSFPNFFSTNLKLKIILYNMFLLTNKI